MKLKTKISPKSLSRLRDISIVAPSSSYPIIINSHAKQKKHHGLKGNLNETQTIKHDFW